MIQRYSADAVRYWAASSGPGKDSVISEEKIQQGTRLVTKLWNVAQFSQRFLEDFQPPVDILPGLSPADRWILSRLQKLIRRATDSFLTYDYSTAKSEVEVFFWTELADNYLEMVKQRLYLQEGVAAIAARYTLNQVIQKMLLLFAPLLPYVCEVIYQDLFSGQGRPGAAKSSHLTQWPAPDPALEDNYAEFVGGILVSVATAIRRYKSEAKLPLGASLAQVQLATEDDRLATALREAVADLKSITRAQHIEISGGLPQESLTLVSDGIIRVAIQPTEISIQKE
jgi:valyl-tRNA synthetase